jgi:hypothetical protein
VILTGSRLFLSRGFAMNISTTELVIVCSFFSVLWLMRQQRTPKNVEEIETLRALIRAEIAQRDAEARQMFVDEFTKAAAKKDLRQRLSDWNDKAGV